jgi:hypothetical protein
LEPIFRPILSFDLIYSYMLSPGWKWTWIYMCPNMFFLLNGFLSLSPQ